MLLCIYSHRWPRNIRGRLMRAGEGQPSSAALAKEKQASERENERVDGVVALRHAPPKRSGARHARGLRELPLAHSPGERKRTGPIKRTDACRKG